MKDLAMNLLVRKILFNILTSYIIIFKQMWKSDRLYETKLFKHELKCCVTIFLNNLDLSVLAPRSLYIKEVSKIIVSVRSNFENGISCLFKLMENCNVIRVTAVFKMTFRVNKKLKILPRKCSLAENLDRCGF